VLIGDAGVGKTQMLAAFTRAGDDVQTRPTIGVEFGTKVVDLPDGGQCKAQIWDTAGQERYRAITSSHYRRAQGALVVCDVTQPKSFTNATSLWLRELKEATSPDGGTHECIVLCGNKIDLVPEDETAAVTAEQLEKAGEEHDLLVARTSAITGENIKEAFETLIHKVHEVQLVQQRYQLAQTAAHQAVDLNASQYASSSKKKCC
jgi:small GTP-binding protein